MGHRDAASAGDEDYMLDGAGADGYGAGGDGDGEFDFEPPELHKGENMVKSALRARGAAPLRSIAEAEHRRLGSLAILPACGFLLSRHTASPFPFG